MKAHSAIILDSRRKIKEDKYPVKLRITYRRKRKYYATDYHLSTEEWKKVYGDRPREDYKNIRFKLDKILKEASDFIKELDVFTFEIFEKDFLGYNAQMSNNLTQCFKNYIEILEDEGQDGTAASYQFSINSINKYRKNMELTDVTVDFLNKYESWMVNKEEKSITTVGIYLRNVRKILNDAKKAGIIKPIQYPFGKDKYQIPTGKNVKKATNIDGIQKLISYETVPFTAEDRAKDFWLLSYLCNGANMMDICKFKYANIEGDKLVFYRSKTKRTSRKQKPIVILLTDRIKEIIKKWGTKPTKASDYIFPVIDDEMPSKRKRVVIQQFIKTTNKYMKRIGQELGIDNRLTTIVARHTFSTILKRNGVPISFISDSLGHHNLQTTEHYLGSFEDEQTKAFTSHLLPKLLENKSEE